MTRELHYYMHANEIRLAFMHRAKFAFRYVWHSNEDAANAPVSWNKTRITANGQNSSKCVWSHFAFFGISRPSTEPDPSPK